ncbi:MAG: dihydrofolate reductase family protein [Alphaproteobacteria bacterium]
MTQYFIDGHAIVSADGCYADAAGKMPQALRFDADWSRFQTALDQASLTVLGRKGHEANPMPQNRRRLVVSRRASESDHGEAGVAWVVPTVASLRDALDHLVPACGRVAVVGGTGVFDLFASLGYDTFHLVVAPHVTLPGGRPVFTGTTSLDDVESKLRATGLAIVERLEIDRQNGVVLRLYRKMATSEPG